MKPFIIIISIICFYVCISYSQQKFVVAEGTAQVELPDNKSRNVVKKEAEDLAIINALEKAFGRVVIQGNSTYIQNVNTGEKTETNMVFNMIANTSVKGELIEILNKKFSDISGTKSINGKKENYTEIKCEVKIKAKEITTPPMDYIAFPLKCENINCKTTNFKEGDNLFFYFKSPVNGYLTIYLDDGKTSQCLLPYKHMPAEFGGNFRIIAGQEYILFSNLKEYNYFGNSGYLADNYDLFAQSQEDLSRFFVLFSKVMLNNPILYEDINEGHLTEKERKEGYTMPNALTSENFQCWLNKTRSVLKENLQVQYIDITIRKP